MGDRSRVRRGRSRANRRGSSSSGTSHWYEVFLQRTPVPSVVVRPDGRIVDVNEAFTRAFPRLEEDPCGSNLENWFRPSSWRRLRLRIRSAYPVPFSLTGPFRMASGQERFLAVHGIPLETPEPGHVLMIEDLTEVVAWTDAFGVRGPEILDRWQFINELQHLLTRAYQRRAPLSLVMLKVDFYREMGARYGFQQLEVLLEQLPDLLDIPATARLGRYSDDEYLVLLPDWTLEMARQWAEEARRKVARAPLPVNGVKIPTTVSGCVVGFPDHGLTAHDLIRTLHMGLMHLNRLGSNRVMIFHLTDPSVNPWSQLIQDPTQLVQAMEEGRLVPYYQPILSLDDGTVVGREVLARILLPWGEVLGAGAFIHQLEHLPPHDQIRFDRYLWLRAVRQHMRSGDNAMLFLNLSAAFLGHPLQFLNICRELIHEGAKPNRVVFELSEKIIVRDPGSFQEIVQTARKFGFRFAIDDFGSGFTSFQYLRLVPMEYIKIDGSYIVGIHQSLDNQHFVRVFIQLARHFGIQIIAEHVQDERDMAILKSLGVPLGQGFFLGRPEALDVSSSDESACSA